MLLLKLSARDLLTLHHRDRLVPHLAARWKHFRGEASLGEREAWADSVIDLAEELVGAGLGDVQMLVECQPSGAPGPVDVMLVGRHPTTRLDSYQLVELKRWSSVTRSDSEAAEFVVPGYPEPKEHPAQQLGRFYHFLMGEGPFRDLAVECSGFTYLHNAERETVQPLFGPDAPQGPYARCYTRDSRQEMLEDLRSQLDPEESDVIAERFLRRINVRNTPLLDAMNKARGFDTVFTLRGQQVRVAEDVRRAVTGVTGKGDAAALFDAGQRAVFIVTGGAGSGKSAIGLQLMMEFQAAGLAVKYASGSRAFNAAMQEHVGYGDREFRDSFRYFSSFITPPVPELDVLICDEAHRLRERSTNPRPWMPQGTQPQIDDLLDAARVVVFFLDASQSVRPKEVGTVALIQEAAGRRGIPAPRPYELQGEFRCGGSDAYRRWVRGLLGLPGGEAHRWRTDGLMHVEVADSPEELERIIRTEHHAGASARIVAGFSWPWNKPVGDAKSLIRDVRIGDWHKPWNADSDATCEGGAPPARLWGVRDEGFDQIGCVYTAQGLEWDWCGVIMGEDMVWRTDRWVFQRGKRTKDPQTGLWRAERSGSCDPKVIESSVDETTFQTCVRNAYHVLLTRASRAAVLYSTDRETQEHLKKCVGEVEIMGLRPTYYNTHPAAWRRRSRRRSTRQRPRTKGQLGLF